MVNKIGNSTLYFSDLAILVIIALLLLLIFLLYLCRKISKIGIKKENRSSAFLEATPDLKFLMSRDGTYLDFHINDSSLLVLPANEVIGGNVQELFPQFAKERMRKIDLALQTDKMQIMTYQLELNNSMKSFEARILKSGTDEVIVLVRDITKAEKVKELLKESEKRYRGLIESQSELIVRVDKDGVFTFVNDAYCKTFGKTRDELIGNAFMPLVHEDDIASTLKEMEKLDNPPYRAFVEQRAMTKDGWRWFAWEDSAILNEDGDIIEIQGVGRDITDYKNSVAALEESNQLNKAIIQHSPLSISINRPDGTRITSNEAWKELWGVAGDKLEQFYNDSNVKSRHIFDPDYSQLGEWRERVERVYVHGGQVYIPEIKFDYDGVNSVWVSQYFYSIFDTQGRVSKVVVISEDISEKKNKEQALLEINQLHEAVSDNSPIGVTVRNRYGQLLSTNKAWQDFWEYNSEELKEDFNRERNSLIFDDQETYFKYLGDWKDKVIKIYTEGGHLHIPELVRRRKNNQIQYVSTYFYAIKNALGEVDRVVILTEDITSKKESILALERSEKLSRTVINQSPLGMTVRDKFGNLLTYNKAWCELWQISDTNLQNYLKDKCSSLNFDERDAYLGEWQDKVRNIYEKGGQLHVPTIETKDQKGDKRWISHYFYSIDDNLGNVELVVILTEDITSQKESTLALEKSEKLNRTVIDQSPIGITIRNRDGLLLTYNDAWQNIWQFSKDTRKQIATAPNILDFVGKSEYLSEWQDDINNIYKNGGRLRIPVLETVDHNGQPIWISHYIYSVQDGAGEVDIIVNLTLDVTEQKEAEKSMMESEEKYRTLLGNIPVGVFRGTVEGKSLSLNQAMCTIYGYDSIEEMMQVDVLENYIDLSQREKMIRKMKSQGTIEDYELLMRKKDGGHIWISASLRPYLDAQGEIEYFDGTNVDITERKKAEIALGLSEEKYRTLLENLPVGVYRSSLDMNTVSFNKATAQIYGYDSIEDLENSDVKTHYVDIQEREKILKILKENGFVKNYEIQMKKKNGSIIWISTSLQAHYNESGEIDYFDSLDIDITERKKAELALVESENEYRSLFNNISVGVYRSTINGKVLSLNPAMAAIYGYDSVEEMLQIDVNDSYLESDARKKIMKLFDENDNVENLEKQYKRKNGEIIWVSSNLKASRDKNDEVLYFDGMDIDITERKLAEEELKLAKSRTEALSDASFEAIFFSEKGICIDQNKTAEEMFGYTLEEALGVPGTNWIDESDRELVMNKMLSGNKESYEVTALRKDGTTLPVEIQARMIKYKGKNIRVTSMADITARKLAELALSASEEKFRTLAENASVAIVILQENQIVYMNPISAQMTGYSIEEVIKLGPWILFNPEFKKLMYERSIKRIKGGQVPNNYEVPIKTKSGEDKWVFYSSSLIEYDGKPAILSSGVDITEMKKVQAELDRVEIEKYNQVKEIAGGVAHEIYNSLFPAVTSLDKLKERLKLTADDEVKRNKKLLELTDTAIHRAIKMTEHVTVFSKLKREDVVDDINLERFFADYLHEHESMFGHIKISSKLPQGLCVTISKLHLHSLIHNLMLNAKDALESEKKPQIDIECIPINDMVKISVSDNGSGVSKEIEKKIFDSFFSTKPRTGTGLGLAICKKVISFYGGEISCNTSIDKGTQFSILLPTINIKK